MLSDNFRPFFRIAPGRESGSGGTGPGLAIANEAVRLHDGISTAQNRETGGLQVTITIPFRTPAREEHLQHSMNEASAVQAGTATRGRRELRDEWAARARYD